MRIVRAHFSFIAHVARRVLSIEVTQLLQINSEEIERISFAQHYKRKAVGSKAMIQPFATEEEAGS
jgi:hypothetical protein